MTREERAEKFLKELDILSKKYDFEVTAEGTASLLSDTKEGGWIEFGANFFGDGYKVYDYN